MVGRKGWYSETRINARKTITRETGQVQDWVGPVSKEALGGLWNCNGSKGSLPFQEWRRQI